MNKTSLTLLLFAAACLLLSFLPWPVGETQTSPDNEAVALATSIPDGATLFVAKGCASCHRHDQVNREAMDIFWGDAPDLSRYQGTAEFLLLWLKDPRAVRADAQMPNLNLSQTEIEVLIAFLIQT
jgi:hypothetical protein